MMKKKEEEEEENEDENVKAMFSCLIIGIILK
jgi:hypothetical protein